MKGGSRNRYASGGGSVILSPSEEKRTYEGTKARRIELFERGTYVLVLELTRQRTVRVGSLGRIRFAGGYYAYVGSARKGMRSRVARHLAREKRKRWHIDWLTTLPAALPTAIACTQRTGAECGIASALSNRADLQVEGFGCSDCECGSHLFHFSDAGAVSLALQALVKYGVTVEWLHQPPA